MPKPTAKPQRPRPGKPGRPGSTPAAKLTPKAGGPGIEKLIGRKVVLDTAGPIVYLGVLKGVTPDGFWLEAADLRDRTEGTVTKERYICEAREFGIRANRGRIFVFSHVIISASALDDVITDFPAESE